MLELWVNFEFTRSKTYFSLKIQSVKSFSRSHMFSQELSIVINFLLSSLDKKTKRQKDKKTKRQKDKKTKRQKDKKW